MVIAGCALLTLIAGAFVLTPLFREPKGNLEVELLAETELDRLLNRKAIVYTNLKDLEFEYKMGRLGDADFKRLEAGYKGEAAAILQKLDQMGVEKDLDERIEKDIAASRKRIHSSAPAQVEGPRRCPTCGADLIPGKKFCADCGHRFQASER
jgi:hypothetical protein